MTEAKDPYARHPDTWAEPDDGMHAGGYSAERYGDRAFLTDMTAGDVAGPMQRTEIPLAEFEALKRGETSLPRLGWKYRYGTGLRFDWRLVAITAAIGVAVLVTMWLMA